MFINVKRIPTLFCQIAFRLKYIPPLRYIYPISVVRACNANSIITFIESYSLYSSIAFQVTDIRRRTP